MYTITHCSRHNYTVLLKICMYRLLDQKTASWVLFWWTFKLRWCIVHCRRTLRIYIDFGEYMTPLHVFLERCIHHWYTTWLTSWWLYMDSVWKYRVHCESDGTIRECELVCRRLLLKEFAHTPEWIRNCPYFEVQLFIYLITPEHKSNPCFPPHTVY